VDFLKALRSHHWVLLLLSATALVAAVVPKSTIEYWYAHQELATLKHLDRVTLGAVALSYTSSLVGSSDIGLRVTPQPEVSQIRPRGGSRTITRLLRSYYGDESLSFETATINEIRAAFGMSMWLPIPAPEHIDAFRECVGRRGEAPMNIATLAVEYPEARRDLAVPGDPHYTDTRTVVSQAWPNGRVVPKPHSAQVLVGDEVCLEFPFTFHEYGELLVNYDAASDVLRALKDRRFKPDSPTTTLALSDLPPWLIVSDRTVEDAQRELERLLESSAASPSVFGFATFRSLVVRAIPFLIALTLLTFWLHINAATRVVRAADLKEFAWIGLYSGAVTETVAEGSIFLLPAVAVGLVWTVAGFGPWASVMTFVVGALGLGTVGALRRLRGKL
jgi:hypothetical protein